MNISFVKFPDNYCTTLFSKGSDFAKNLVADNKCIVDLCFMTKTHLSIGIRVGNEAFRMNYESAYSKENNLTLVEKTDFSYFTGEHTTNKYFKVTKKQNKQVLKNHIISLMDLVFNHFYIGELINKDTFEVTVWTPKELLNEN